MLTIRVYSYGLGLWLGLAVKVYCQSLLEFLGVGVRFRGSGA